MNKINFENLPFYVHQIYKEIMDLKSMLKEKDRLTIEDSQYLDIDGTIRLLEKNAYKISLSTLYKLTSTRKIPHTKFLGEINF